jgi:MFS family permease
MDDVREGLRFIIRNPLLRTIVITATIANFLQSPMFSVVFPVFINQVYGEATRLGWLLAAFGAGSVAGAIGYGAVGHALPRRLLFIGGFGGVGLGIAVFTLLPLFPIMIAANVAIGIVAGPLNPMIRTLLQERTPPELLARVFGTVVALAVLATPAGVLLAGYLIESIGVQNTIIAIAVGSVVVGGSLFFSRPLRTMEG